MESIKKNPSALLCNFLIPVIVSLCVFGLFYLDYETRSIADLFTLQNLVAFALYFFPTVLICYSLNYFFLRKNSPSKSMFKALLIGIPSGFVLLIVLFLLNR